MKGEVPPLRLPTFDFRTGEPLSPTCKVLRGACDGLFGGEADFGRVTGNNVVSWTPGKDSWYETVKLNYGFDFTDPAKQHRNDVWSMAGDVPDTWQKMDAILAYWQNMGVDGFRCDMAHLIPPEFWRWAIQRARGRKPDVFFVAEAYNDDPAKVWPIGGKASEHVMETLVAAGFDAVYDDPSYKTAKRIYESPAWANDLDAATKNDVIFQHSLRYAENHDEVRLAAPTQWGGLGMEAGRAVCGALFALSRGPVMIYSGQEVGEPAAGAEGFGGDDARTSIFDYWLRPELVRWMDGHTYHSRSLSIAQRSLRGFYARLLHAMNEPAFRDGEFFPLNPDNARSDNFGKVEDDPVEGHWLYGYLRYDARSGQRILVLVNLHPTVSFEHVSVPLSSAALDFLNLPCDELECREMLTLESQSQVSRQRANDGLIKLEIECIPSLTPFYFEMKINVWHEGR